MHRSLLGGPLFDCAKEDWDRAIKAWGIDQKYVEYAKRSERVGMLTVLTSEGTLRRGEVIVRLASAVVHNRDKGSITTKIFNPTAGIEENCKRVGFAFLELVAERSDDSQSLPWEPAFPLEMLKAL